MEGQSRPARSDRPYRNRADGFLLLLAALLIPSLHAAQPSPPPRLALPGWKLELLLEAPAVRSPSVVAAAPDGRIFIGEDPMDLSTPRADAAEGRILCRHPDGRVTIYADKLYAPFGLQYLDGRLYVLHNPRFSVFDDGGDRGTNRVDLIEQTNPNPSALDWNDHVPANFRLGMDGFFYMAVGDKGVYGATGRDGKRVDLPGGGILRLRPDGTGLEPFCLGVRNIMDVAINDEDELFTYDNTDEHEWMGRVTHMVEGGFYGYPHDFIPRRPYTLWCFADLGAGAATGAFALSGEGLPADYAGNLVLADFGKRQLVRVRVERDGGTFRVVPPSGVLSTNTGPAGPVAGLADTQPFFEEPPEDFRPVGIAPGADGRSILVCDWQHRDSKDTNAVCGRLWKLTWTGPNALVARPDWYVAAASGRPYEASTAQLVAGLSHPSREVRLCAQRRLIDRGRAAAGDGVRAGIVGSLTALYSDSNSPVLARLHGLWALDGIDEARSARAAILESLRDPNPSVRRQAIRQLGLRRVAESAAAIRPQLWHDDASIRREAAAALGRFGDVGVALHILASLDDSDLFARFTKFTSLNQIGRRDPRVWGHLVRALEADRPELRQSAVFAMRDTFDKALLERLSAAARDSQRPMATRVAALQIAASMHRQPPAWKGEWGAYHPFRNPPPARTVNWAGTPQVLSLLNRLLGETDASLRRAAIAGLAEARETNAAPELRRVFAREFDVPTRQAVIEALGRFADPGAIPLCRDVLMSSPGSQELAGPALTCLERIGSSEAAAALIAYASTGPMDLSLYRQAIRALGELKAQSAIPALSRALKHPDTELASVAALALGRIGGSEALAELRSLLEDPAGTLRRPALQALGAAADRGAIPRVLELWRDPALRTDAFAFLARVPDTRALDAYLDALGSRSPEQRTAARRALKAIQGQVLGAVEARVPALPPATVVELQEVFRELPAAADGPIFKTTARAFAPEDYLAKAASGGGDPARGRKLFADSMGMNCVGCHRVANEGGDVGPDLSGIGAQSDRRALAESVLYPSRVVREGYQRTVIETRDGEEYSGLLKGENADMVTLRDAAGQLQQVRKADIKDRRRTDESLMPEGLQSALSLEEFQDLIAYLASLGAPK